MRTIRMACLLGGLAVVVSGCATLMGGGSDQPVSLNSAPGAAGFTIQSSSGLQMAQGATPATVSLPRRNEYEIRISLDGYHPQTTALTRGINGWIWGNLFVGWIVGFGIDFLTGSAYKLEPAYVHLTLQQVEDETFAVVYFLDSRQKVLEERRLLMVPLEHPTEEEGPAVNEAR